MSGNDEIYLSLLFLILIIAVVIKYYPRKFRRQRFVKKWLFIQSLCKTKETWSEAVLEAEILLKKAVTLRKFKGKNMGEKLTYGQRSFSDNDSLWRAYKIYKKVKTNDKVLRESDVKNTLIGFRQALRDLGALPKDDKK
ncbi:MAG TPA: hypothetical protein VMR76_01190 [Candidatus Saccharimonadia bacterium]|nr:hypothetical protein [Candidatus Saccharimonadia bacterium]